MHLLLGSISLTIILSSCSRGTAVATRKNLAQEIPEPCSSLAADWRPPVSGDWKEILDSSEIVTKPSEPTIQYYRTRFVIWFADTASGPEVCRLLEEYHAAVVGGLREASGADSYVIAVSDPGPDWDEWEALFARLSAEPGIQRVHGLPYGVRAIPPLERTR